jgi:hypothetical protein
MELTLIIRNWRFHIWLKNQQPSATMKKRKP